VGKRLLARWYQMTLNRKLYMAIGSVGIIMGFSIFINLKVAYIFIDDARGIMDDNLACYKFQESMAQERGIFASLISSRTLENLEIYQRICQDTKAYLSSLPYEYDKIGEDRYGVTWNIINGYETYEKQKDTVPLF